MPLNELARLLRMDPGKVVPTIRKALEDRYNGAGMTIKWMVSIDDGQLKIEGQLTGIPPKRQPEKRQLRLPASSYYEVSDFILGCADAASAIWRLTAGCDDCGDPDPDGLTPVNADCETCVGEGTIR